MKTRPILFSGPMVRALLREAEQPGTGKTQTRRPVKPQPEISDGSILRVGRDGEVWGNPPEIAEQKAPLQPLMWEGKPLHCPYGQPGDLLWCRESFSGPWGCRRLKPSQWPAWCAIWYWADGSTCEFDATRPKPSIHMPRWASRLTLEITDVRVERLQDISEEDCDAECFGGDFPHVVLPELFPDADKAGDLSLVQCFERLWDSINGPLSFSRENPWVWALTFKVHHCNVDELLRKRNET